MGDNVVEINLTAVDGKTAGLQVPSEPVARRIRPMTAISRISKILSDGSVSSYDSDSEIEDFGIRPIRSEYLTPREAPQTAKSQRKHPDLRGMTYAAKRRVNVISTLNKEVSEDGISWIQSAFEIKECDTFLLDKDDICHCGRKKDEHEKLKAVVEGTVESPPWDDLRHCTMSPTNALGTMHSSGGGRASTRYIRLSNESEFDDVMHLLRKHWHLKPPGIALSMIGSAEHELPCKLSQTLMRDLTKVGRTARAWYITEGLDTGVSELIGSMMLTHSYPAPAIAFPHWGSISGKEALLSDEAGSHTYYNAGMGSYRLDGHHSHNLLVDDGRTGPSRAHEKYRLDFEEYLQKMWNVPLLYISVGGTELDGKFISNLLEQGRVVTLVKGSGGFTDDYCDFHAHLEEQIPGEKCSCPGGVACQDILDKMDHDPKIQVLSDLWKHSQNGAALSIYDVSKNSNFDSHVLKLLVTCLPGGGTVDKQLEIARNWSRVDIAEHILGEHLDATSGARMKEGITRTLFHGLIWGHAEFCGLLIENGADILDIQANLLTLYESAYFTPRSNHVIHLLEKYGSFEAGKPLTVDHVNALLNRIIRNGFTAYTTEETDPYFELMVWAALMLNENLAVLLWKYTQDPVRSALLCVQMLWGMKSHVYLEKADDKRRVKELYAVFESLAISVLEKGWESDSNLTRQAMLSKWDRMKGYNYNDLAFHAHARRFVAHPACQEIISAGWRGKFKKDTRFLYVLLIILFPFLVMTPLAPFDKKVRYKRAVQGRYRVKYIDKLTGLEALFKRADAFYSTPVTKFWMNIFLYLIFICFHCYTLLYQMRFIKDFSIGELYWTEIVIWLWVILMIVEEAQEIIRNSFNKNSSKITYAGDSWNRLEWAVIILYVIGLIFRSMPDDGLFLAGRTIIAVASVPIFLRLLMIFEYKLSLGPILLMLREMCTDLGIFLFLLIIFLVGFGISYVAILIPPERMSWLSVSAVFMYPYFQMFGDFYLDVFELEGSSSYVDKTFNANATDARITTAQSAVSVALLVTWVMISTVGLVNLLIAMFSDTYRNIKDNQLIIWKFQRYKILVQYRSCTVPPPFSLFHYMVWALRWVVRRCTGRNRAVRPDKHKNDHWKDIMVRTFMQDVRDEYLSSLEEVDQNEVLNKLKTVEQHLRIMRRVGNNTSSLYA